MIGGAAPPGGRGAFAAVLLSVLVAGFACSPIMVMTTDAPAGGQLELDEAEVRCADREACACYAVGAFHAHKGDSASARAPLERACALGCAPGCSDLSEATFEGHGGERPEPALGTRYAIRACKLEASRCAPGGERFETGHDVARDDERARIFYREGCRRGDAASCSGLRRLGER